MVNQSKTINTFKTSDFIIDKDQTKIKDALEIVKLFYNIKIICPNAWQNDYTFEENEVFNLSVALTEKYINTYECKPIQSYESNTGWNNYVLLILKNIKKHIRNSNLYILTYDTKEKAFKIYIENYNFNTEVFIFDSACVTKIFKNEINSHEKSHIKYRNMFLNAINKAVK